MFCDVLSLPAEVYVETLNYTQSLVTVDSLMYNKRYNKNGGFLSLLLRS